jgi:transcriptional regulator with XRE-family HTH domain
VKATLQEQVRARVRRLVEDGDVSHAIIGTALGLSRSAATRIITGTAAISLARVERICEFFQITAAELMTEPGALIQPLVPIEAAILDVVRKMDKLRQHSLLDVLEWQRASSLPTKRGRIDALSSEDAMVLSLYRAISDSDAQAGIVMQMRGYVQAKREFDSDGGRGRK